MTIAYYYPEIIIGLILSLIIVVKFGVFPGGLVVPGYLALVADRPAVLLAILLVSILSYVIVRFAVSKIVLIYGWRRFIACVLAALAVKFLLGLLFPFVPFSVFSLSVIGAVVSGILADRCFRQSIPITVAAAAGVTAITYGLILAIGFFI